MPNGFNHNDRVILKREITTFDRKVFQKRTFGRVIGRSKNPLVVTVAFDGDERRFLVATRYLEKC